MSKATVNGFTGAVVELDCLAKGDPAGAVS
jgi:hypothetical protein